jgi:hypothetical protein
MAYINKETKKTIVDALKKEHPMIKFSASIPYHSKISFKVYNDAIFEKRIEAMKERLKWQALQRRETFNGVVPDLDYYLKNGVGASMHDDFLKPIVDTIKKAGQWYDKSDIMTDYFETAFHFDFTVFPAKK